LAITVAATSFGVTLLGGVFGGILAALHRFDLLGAIAISQTTVRALGVVWLLREGHGIVALACWEFVVVLTANLVLVLLAFRNYPQLEIVLDKPAEEILNAIWGFSAYVFIIQVCVQVMYYTDNLVVGACVSAASVTFYSIGGTLIEYIRQLTSSLVTMFLPLASKLEAEGQRQKLQNLLIKGTNAALAAALPVEVALLFRGPTFIRLWMGSQYATESGRVLQILLLGHILSVTTHTSANIAYGMGRPKPMVLWRVGEAAANLVLSIILVGRMGISGVAWGTTVPSLFISLFFFPRFVSKMVGLRVSTYLRRSWLPPFLGVIPFALACFVTDRYWHATTLVHFFVQLIVILPIYILSIAFFFGRDLLEFLQSLGVLPARLSRLLRPSGSEKEEAGTAGFGS
jgi:O-antigen/teichoic acid export membrane protein